LQTRFLTGAGGHRGSFFVSVSQFGTAFSFHCILAFMPFHIIRISPFGPKETMVWIGMILGSSNIFAALAASFWGGLTSRFSPKLLFERGMLCNGILMFLMGFIDNLYFLLLLRIIQGVLGGVSTIGLVLVSSLSPEERLPRDLSLFQNSITAGQLLGPPVGAYAASFFGYRAPFILASVIVCVSLFFCHACVSDIPPQKRKALSGSSFNRLILTGWVLSLVITIHLTFLPSILPSILEGLQLKGDVALSSAGLIIMAYTGTAIFGNYLLSRLSPRVGLRNVIAVACVLGSLLQVSLIFGGTIWSFTLIRMLQMGLVAVVVPLIISIFARDAGGKVLGFLNSSRFVGGAVGPVMATSVLAYSSLLTLYALIAAFTLASLWAFLASDKIKGISSESSDKG